MDQIGKFHAIKIRAWQPCRDQEKQRKECFAEEKAQIDRERQEALNHANTAKRIGRGILFGVVRGAVVGGFIGAIGGALVRGVGSVSGAVGGAVVGAVLGCAVSSSLLRPWK